MKKILFLFVFTASIFTVNSQAKVDKTGHLIGYAEKSDFSNQKFSTWFDRNYNAYTPNGNVVKKIKKKLKGVSVVCFMGTWCGDSKRETPRFYKVMEAADFNFKKKFKLVAVNRTKKTPDNLQKGLNIIRVPTFIFYKKGKEIGRYVEYPRESMEKDFLKILSGESYKHSYEK